MNEETKTPAANSKLSTIFLVVLGLHVAVIVAFIAYNLLKGNTNSPSDLAEQTPIEEINSTALEPAAMQQEPALQTEQNPIADMGAPVEAEAGTNMSMPASSDPIYENAGHHAPVAQADQRVVAPAAPAQTVIMAAEPAATLITAAPVKSMGTYAAVKGDSLARIARNHQISLQELRAANDLKSDNVKIGQAFRIPSPGVKAAIAQSPLRATPVANSVASPVTAKTGFSEYTVAAGDTLWKIAKSFNTQPSEIAKLNGITDPSKLKVGSTIKVPTSSSQEASAPKAQPVRTNVQKSDVAMVPVEQR